MVQTAQFSIPLFSRWACSLLAADLHFFVNVVFRSVLPVSSPPKIQPLSSLQYTISRRLNWRMSSLNPLTLKEGGLFWPVCFSNFRVLLHVKVKRGIIFFGHWIERFLSNTFYLEENRSYKVGISVSSPKLSLTKKMKIMRRCFKMWAKYFMVL